MATEASNPRQKAIFREFGTVTWTLSLGHGEGATDGAAKMVSDGDC